MTALMGLVVLGGYTAAFREMSPLHFVPVDMTALMGGVEGL